MRYTVHTHHGCSHHLTRGAAMKKLADSKEVAWVSDNKGEIIDILYQVGTVICFVAIGVMLAY